MGTTQSAKPEIASISIRNLINRGGETASSKKVGLSDSTTKDHTAEEQEVTYDNLKFLWQQYTKSIESQNPRLFSILNNCTPELTDDKIIVVKVDSTFQEGELDKYKSNLTQYLRKELKNSTVLLEVVVEKNEIKAAAKTYTSAEKLSAMMKKNPALQILKENFNLDIS